MNESIEFPYNYKRYWVEEFDEWVVENAFLMLFGAPTYVTPTHHLIYSFENDTLLAHQKSYEDKFTPDLIEVYVEMNIDEGWMEVYALESLGAYYMGRETYEEGTYIGAVGYASRLKSILVNKFWDIKVSKYDEDSDIYLDDDDSDFRWRDDGGPDVAWGSEGTS